MNEYEQVIAARNRDADAFAALVARYYGMVYGLAYAHLREPAAAQDVAQDAFLLAWVNLPRLHHPEGFLMWLRRIVRNCALNWLRSDEYRRKLSARLADGEAGGAYAAPGAIARLEKEDRMARLREGLGQLSPKLREALVVFYLEGKSVRQAADSLGVKAETLKKRLQLGRAKLRVYLESLEEAELEEAFSAAPAGGPRRVMMALSAGPVAPALSGGDSGSGFLGLWLDHVLHGGSVRLSEAGLALAGGLKVASVSVVVAAGVLMAGGVFVSVVSDRHESPEAPPAGPAMQFEEEDHEPGIGIITVGYDSGTAGHHLLVLGVLADTPAASAGLRLGDRIVAIDGQPLSEDHGENIRRIRGPLGSNVHLTVLRSNRNAEGQSRFEFTAIP